MRGMFIDQRLRWVTKQQLRNDEKPNVFFAVQGFLENKTSITVGRQFDDVSSS